MHATAQTFLRTEELENAHKSSRIWNETWLAAFFDKPCNYELFVRQNLNLETAIRKAFRVRWLRVCAAVRLSQLGCLIASWS